MDFGQISSKIQNLKKMSSYFQCYSKCRRIPNMEIGQNVHAQNNRKIPSAVLGGKESMVSEFQSAAEIAWIVWLIAGIWVSDFAGLGDFTSRRSVRLQ